MSDRDAFDMFHRLDDRGRFGDNETRRAPGRQRVTGATNSVKIAGAIHLERPSAVLFSSRGDITQAAWLPLSKVEIVITGPIERKRNGRTLTPCQVAMPEWLAKEKGLI